MKKVFFTFAFAMMASAMFAFNGSTSDENAAVAVVNEGETTVVQRGYYKLEIPADWTEKQFVSSMTLEGPNGKLTVKDDSSDNFEDWKKSLKKAAEKKLKDITVGDFTWNVFKKARDFKIVYITIVGRELVYVGSSFEDPNDATVLKILGSIKLKK